jgi:transketolase
MQIYKEDGNYQLLARKIRRCILDLVHRTKSPHIGSSFSCVEILIALYCELMHISPENPGHADRDRLILSKGHACPALYAVLAEKGLLSQADLRGFAADGGTLEQHPKRDVARGIEVSTGSLGHGLSIGIGMALAAEADAKPHMTYVLLGDGELNEGSVWEAAMFAAHHALDNLVAIVDYNQMQALGFSKDVIDLAPLSARWSSFGWVSREVDGHDVAQLCSTLKEVPFRKGSPSILIAHTVKGRGVSFMENQLLWHYRCPSDKEYRMALEELSV